MELWEVKNYLISLGVDKNKIDEAIKKRNHKHFFLQYNVFDCTRCGKWYIKYQTGSDGKCNDCKND